MNLHPIQFSGPMLHAIIDRNKSQTRRVITEREARRGMGLPQTHLIDLSRATIDKGFPDRDGAFRYGYLHVPFAHPRDGWEKDPSDDTRERCYAKWSPGDVLWVREAHRYAENEHGGEHIVFEADNAAPLIGADAAGVEHLIATTFGNRGGYEALGLTTKKRPAMFHRMDHCRIFLRVESVRAERLQEITRGDAMAEGCPFPNMAKGPDPRDWYRDLWNSINAKRGHPWEKNDWVFVNDFSVLSVTGVEGLEPEIAALVRENIERLAGKGNRQRATGNRRSA